MKKETVDVEFETLETHTVQPETKTSEWFFNGIVVLTVLATGLALWSTYAKWSNKYPPQSLHPTHQVNVK